jgi:predicted small lipoprotein YifL
MKRLILAAALLLVVAGCGKRTPLDIPPPPNAAAAQLG